MSKYPGNIITTGANTGYSVFFDGTGDQLTLADNAALDLSTGDFTVECWFYITSSAVNSPIIRRFDGDAGSRSDLQYAITYTSSGSSLVLSPYQGVTTLDITFSGVSINQWHHCALVRTGNTVYGFLDGVRNATSRGVTTMNTGAWLTYIGGYREGGVDQWCNGYISNVRIIKGTALYTGATYNVPTQLQNISGTSLLTCNSPAIVDQSSNNFAITVAGNAAVSTFTPFAGYQAYNPALGAATPGIWTVSDALQAAANRSWNMYDPYFNQTTLKLSGTPVTNVPTWITDASTNNFAVTPVADARAANLSPFSLTTFPNSGSGYFDGTGDYLTVPSNTAFDFGSGDFCIEFFLYKINSTISNILTKRPNFTTAGFPNIFVDASNKINIEFGGSPAVTLITTTAITLSSWVHVAIVRSGSASGNVKCYINGTADATTATLVSIATNTNALVVMGDTNNYYTTGYLSNLRLVKGVAVYTGNFTTPTAPLTATQPAGTNIAAITGSSTSLLTLQNSQSSNNNSFLDSSSNNFLITRSGNATQGTFTPFSQTGWSNFFNGSTDSLTYSSGITFGTSQFCIEFWFYYTGTFAAQAGVYGGGSSGVNSRLNLRINSTSVVIDQQGVANQSFTVPTIAPNTWNHLVVCRNSSVATVFLNGIRSSTGTTANTVNYSTATDVIGQQVGVSFFPGYLSNFRVILGSTPYDPTASTITVPTSPLTPITNTVLLTCQSNRFFDANTQIAAKTFTVTGAPSVQTFSPFQTNVAYTPATIGGSGYFDGATDELSMVDNAAFDLSSTDFTIEAWVYPTVINATNEICAQWGGAGNAPYLFKIVTAGRLQFVWTIGGGSGNTLTGTTVAAVVNQWNHVAVTRSGGTLSLFVNGVRDGTTGAITGAITNGTNPLYVGSIGGSEYLNGYMSGFRFIKGQALATSNFTPPTAPVNATQVGWNGSTASLTGTVSALLNFTNAGIVDTTGKNVLETVSDARISTAVSKFGGSSMFFDGTGDRLYRSDVTPNFGFGTGDYTVEFWLYVVALPGSKYTLIDFRTTATAQTHTIYVTNSGYMGFYNGTSDVTSSSQPVTTGAWFHIAYARSSGTLRIFVNGVQAYSAANTIDYQTTRSLTIGDAVGGQPGECLNGYIQDLRITKGYARYTGAFTPPTSLLQNQ